MKSIKPGVAFAPRICYRKLREGEKKLFWGSVRNFKIEPENDPGVIQMAQRARIMKNPKRGLEWAILNDPNDLNKKVDSNSVESNSVELNSVSSNGFSRVRFTGHFYYSGH